MTNYRPQALPTATVLRATQQLHEAWRDGNIRTALNQVEPGSVKPLVALRTGLSDKVTADAEQKVWSDVYRALRHGPLSADPTQVAVQLLVGHLDLQHPVELAVDEEEDGWAVWTTIAPQPFPTQIAQIAAEEWCHLVKDVLRDGAGLDLSDGQKFSSTFGDEVQQRLTRRLQADA